MNIANLVGHLDELLVCTKEQTLDVLTINETRLDDTISNVAIAIPGYNVVRKDLNRKGGGVAIYARKNFSFIERNELNTCNFEITCIEISKFYRYIT